MDGHYEGQIPQPVSQIERGYSTTGALAPPQPNRVRRIEILQLDYGYQVTVGCQTMAFESKEKIITNLMAYLNDPEATEKKYREGELFK